jgi:hypothetical protein
VYSENAYPVDDADGVTHERNVHLHKGWFDKTVPVRGTSLYIYGIARMQPKRKLSTLIPLLYAVFCLGLGNFED